MNMRKVIYAIVILVSTAALVADCYLVYAIIQNNKTVSEAVPQTVETEEIPEKEPAPDAQEQILQTVDPAEEIPDEEAEKPEEPVQDFSDAEIEKDFNGPYDLIHFPSENERYTDVTGCKTFEDIIGHLESGQCYAYVYMSGKEVLLVSLRAFNEYPDHHFAIGADAYCYDQNGTLTFCGELWETGPSYPLKIDGGILSMACNGFAQTIMLENDRLVTAESCYVDPDSGEYVYYTVDGDGPIVQDPVYGEMIHDAMFQEYFWDAMDVEFTMI